MTLYNLGVAKGFDDGLTFLFITEDDSNLSAMGLAKGTTVKGKICPTYQPAFQAGQHLLKLHYEDHIVCWDLFNMHPKYLVKHDANGDTINDPPETAQAVRRSSNGE